MVIGARINDFIDYDYLAWQTARQFLIVCHD